MNEEKQAKPPAILPMLLLCVLGALAIFSSTMSKSPVLPYFAESLGAGPEQMGFIAAASTVPGIIVSAPAGIVVDRRGPRLMLWVAAALFAFTPLLYLFVALPAHLILVRFVHGFATAILGPVALAIVAGWYEARRAERMALYSSSTRVGRMLAPTLGGFLLAFPVFSTFGATVYQGVYLGCALLGLAALGITVVLPVTGKKRPEQPANPARQPVRDMLRPVLKRVVLLVCLAEAATFVLFGAWEFFTPLFWTDVVGIPEPLTGPLLTLFTATVLVASPGLGALSDRWGRRGFITGGLTALCLLMIIQGFLLNPLIQAGLVMLIGLAMAATVTSSAPLITEVVEAQVKGTALGLLGTIMDVGQALGPICVGLLLAIGGGYTFAFLVVCGVLLLIPLLLLIGLDPTPSQS